MKFVFKKLFYYSIDLAAKYNSMVKKKESAKNELAKQIDNLTFIDVNNYIQ